jgi:hypothetical protein
MCEEKYLKETVLCTADFTVVNKKYKGTIKMGRMRGKD